MDPVKAGRGLALRKPGLTETQVLEIATAAGADDNEATLMWMGYCSQRGRIKAYCILGPHNARKPSPPELQPAPPPAPRWLQLIRLLFQRPRPAPGAPVQSEDR